VKTKDLNRYEGYLETDKMNAPTKLGRFTSLSREDLKKLKRVVTLIKADQLQTLESTQLKPLLTQSGILEDFGDKPDKFFELLKIATFVSI